MGFGVIKLIQTAQSIEGYFNMTFLAIRAQIVVVGIFMTTVAVAEFQPCEMLKFFAVAGFFFMTLDTVYGFVFAGKGKLRSVVIKPCSRCEGIGGMAFRAVCR